MTIHTLPEAASTTPVEPTAYDLSERPASTAPGAPTPAATAAPGRLTRLWRGPADDPSWARPSLLALLGATLVFYLWHLTANGYANSFYSAAAQAGSQSWSAWFFGSFDASNAITVDKPPAALWIMGLSVRLFGLNSAALLVPEVLMGVASVGIVYAAVKRYAGAAAGLLAGAVLALTPVAVLMFRFNNPDALLTLLMAAAAYATLRAIEHGSVRWMTLTGVLIGFGFLAKTLQVLLVVPFLGLAFLLLANTSLRRRIFGSLAAAGSMLLAAGWWVAIVELLPASMRPYIGGSQTNSFLDLTFGYNGLGRLSGNETGSVGGGGGGPTMWGATGWTRLFNSSNGGQISWLIPAALVLLVGGLILRGRAPRSDLRRASYVVWGGWLLVTMAVFSFMAGIFHEYYSVALAPAIAALIGLGAAEAWEQRRRPLGAIVLSLATLAAAGWGFVLLTRTTAYPSALRITVLAVGVAAALLFLVIGRLHRVAVPLVVAGALGAGLAGPTAYSLSTIATAHTGSIVVAGPDGRGGPGGGPGGMQGGAPPRVQVTPGQTSQGTDGAGPQARGGGGMGGLLDATTPDTEVVAALQADASSYRWVVAAVGSQNAAGLQLGSGEPVMSVGGFNGSDPAPTLAQFQAYVAAGDIHYFLASSGGGPGGGLGNNSNGGSNVAGQIASWVAANFTQVTIGGTTFYDLTQPLAGGASTSSAT